MISFRTLIIAVTAASFSLVSYAQSASKHDAHHPQAAADMTKPTPMQDSAAPMARMDAQMKAMQAMHDGHAASNDGKAHANDAVHDANDDGWYAAAAPKSPAKP